MEDEFGKMLRLRALKERLNEETSMSLIADIIDSLSEDDAKWLLRLYVYDR